MNWELLFYLLVGHALADYVWQPELVAKQKSPSSQPLVGLGPWWWTMLAHGLINGGVVAFLTQQVWMGVLEMGLHAGMDTLKCVLIVRCPAHASVITWLDQGVHLGCKVLWASLA